MGSGASVSRKTGEASTLQWEKFLHSNQVAPSAPTLTEDDRVSGVYVQGRGTLRTCMFEERINICRYFDAQTGLWLLLPLHWEMDVDFVRYRVQQVMKALPGLADQKEIAAALRQCNYDPDEVISIYLTIFGDVLLEPHKGAQSYPDSNLFRSHSEKNQVIEDLQQRLQLKEKEAEDLLQRSSCLSQESQHLSDVVQNLTRRVVQLEADKQVAMEKLRALLSHTNVPPARANVKASVDHQQLQQASGLARELSVSGKQLRSTVHNMLADMQEQLQQFRAETELMIQRQQEAHGAVEELHSLYQKEASERRALCGKLLELQGNIRVFCRCRRQSDSAGSTGCLEVVSDQELLLVQKGGKKKFVFDSVFSSSASQEQVLDGTLPIITSCLDGYNVCILAYGQSGSGKNYTMMGLNDSPGINIWSVTELLRLCKERENCTYTIKISMLEIYVESLIDLLCENPHSEVEIRTQGRSVTVPGLTQVEVRTDEDILSVMEMGDKHLHLTPDEANIESSCSHLLLIVTVERTDIVCGVTTRGTLTLCELAGSERISKTQATGQRLTETASINKSLMALRQVFSALKSNALHVPYRNSKLTHLLQPCLSGDAKVCVFVHVSPDVKDAAETLNTLTFGSSIRQIALGKAPQNRTPAKTTKAEK
ncbi:kinesin-like protein KIN-14R [Colossoma macropomum]|uniref:kinesin-like protein KIN-14R n=1 Tax=Colossoma macropomum TaxID=42526 RepID=UPI001864D27F|nr:kinesin-like protein KIN-14R [Colossoma macropomum]